MVYRDENEALRAEVEVLRRENADYRDALTRAGDGSSKEISALQSKVTWLEELLTRQICSRCARALEAEK